MKEPETMKLRPYDGLQRIVEEAGGRMFHEKKGHPRGGAWVVLLRGIRREIKSNQAGFPEMDRLYVPNVPCPKHYSDYSSDLIAGAREQWLDYLASPA